VNLEKSRELTLEGFQVLPFIVQGRILGRHDRGNGAEEGKIDEVPRGRSLFDGAPFLPLPMGPVNPVVENEIGRPRHRTFTVVATMACRSYNVL